MKKETLVCIVIALGILALYLWYFRSKHEGYENKGPCDYMSDDGYSSDYVKSCQQYQDACGLASNVEEQLQMSELYMPGKDADVAMSADVAAVQKTKSACQPPAPCKTSDDCPPFDIRCNKGACQ